jgi:hypothetical protein
LPGGYFFGVLSDFILLFDAVSKNIPQDLCELLPYAKNENAPNRLFGGLL